MMPKLPGAVPEIPVSDAVAATAYYRDKLGFNVDWLDAELALAGISRDDCRISSPAPHSAKSRAASVP